MLPLLDRDRPRPRGLPGDDDISGGESRRELVTRPGTGTGAEAAWFAEVCSIIASVPSPTTSDGVLTRLLPCTDGSSSVDAKSLLLFLLLGTPYEDDGRECSAPMSVPTK
jgi:hypothetical protein